jgi:PqqD family protein of HPr-rel-A system
VTHLVSEPVPEILAALSAGPATATELTQRLVTDFGLQMRDETSTLLAERLFELEVIGLVWRL